MTPEGKVKEQIKKVLNEAGAWYFMPVPVGYGKRGIPDFIGVLDGKFFAIEAKSPDGIINPWQADCMNDMRKAGATVDVCRSLEDAVRFVQLLKRK